MQIQDTATIAAPVDVLWDVTLDIAGLPELTPTVTRVEPLDPLPLGVGGRARLTQPGLSPKVWTVTELEPNRRFVWETTHLGVRMVGRHEMRAVDGGSENTLTLQLEGFGAGLMGLLAKRKLAQTLATENAGFRRVAEARVARDA
jgi:uncharacterized membrane protein